MNKQSLRTRLQKQRDRIPGNEKERMDASIAEHLFGWEIFQTSKIIFCFVSFRSEVNTYPIIEKSMQLGKTVATPRVNLSTKNMDACIIDDVFTSLEEGYYGIPEPVKSCKIVDYRSIELIITPGLAFTVRGERLGYGGGFYDRFMERHSHATSSALTYDRFILKELPVKDHDLPVDYVITESGIKAAMQERI